MDLSDAPCTIYRTALINASDRSCPFLDDTHLPKYSALCSQFQPFSYRPANPCFSPIRCANFSDQLSGLRGGGSWREKCVRASRAKTPLLLLSPFNPSKELGVRVYRKEKRGGRKREQCRFVLLDREDRLLDRSIEGIDTNFARFEIFLRRNVGRRLLKGNKKARDNTVILLLLYPESYRILASRFSVEPTTIIFAFDPGKCRLSHVSPISRNNHVHTYIRNTDTGEMRMKIRRLRFVGANR